MRRYKNLNISANLKEISEILKTGTTTSKRLVKATNCSAWIALGLFLIAVISLILNYNLIFPKAKLKIEDATLNFDIKAKDDSTFLDSLYVKMNIINDGNKSTSVNKINVDIIDSKEPNIFTAYKFIRSPGILEPGCNAEVILKIEPIMVSQNKEIKKYKVPYKSFKAWQQATKKYSNILSSAIVTFPIEGRITLKIDCWYGDGKKLDETYKRKLKYIEPIDLTLPPLSRPRIINYE